MKIAYLTNQYPKTSHSFIRREILAVEGQGLPVHRFSVRSLETELVDEADWHEYEKTRFILHEGAIGLMVCFLSTTLTRPWSVMRALKLTFKVGWRSERGLLINLIYLAESCILLKWCREIGITHVHVHFGTNPTTVAMLCHSLGGPPYSFTVHGPEEFDKPSAISLTEKINRSAFVVAISSFCKSQLFRWCSHDQWSKIHIVHCCVDDSFLKQPHTPLPKSSQLVCVGRICEQKGHLILLEASSRLVEEGFDFRLILVGDGPLRSESERLISEFGLTEHIWITGWSTNSEVRQHIIDSKVMVLPSFAEGLPVVIMESLALGRPVISTYVAGIPELLEHNECGWLVPAGSATALAVAMREALQASDERLDAMGKKGSSKVARYHSADTEANRLVALFEHYRELPVDA